MNFFHALLIIILMIMINAFFSAYEMALASISRTKLTYLVQIKSPGAIEALFMKDRMEASFAVVQMSVTLVGSIAAAIGGAGTTLVLTPYYQQHFHLSHNWAEFLGLVTLIIPLSSLTIIFAELIPKIFAIKNNEFVLLKLSKVMIYFYYIANPIASFFEFIVKSAIDFIDRQRPVAKQNPDVQGSLYELTAALSMARTTKLIGAQQEKIVMSAAQLSLRPIRAIMIPAADIGMISTNSSLSEALVLAHLDMHTRFPVCEQANDPQSITGYINFKDIIAALKINPEDPTLRGIIRPIIRFQDTSPISRVFERMIQEKVHIGLVEDAQKKVVGMITQEDIIEELVGEIEDEYDRLPSHILRYGNQWLIGGAVPMSALAKTLELNPVSACGSECDLRLADWCQRHSQRAFYGGEVINGNGFQITVRKLRRKKICEAFVAKS